MSRGQPCSFRPAGRVVADPHSTASLGCVCRGAPLSQGWISNVEGHDCVVCPYHGWAFDERGLLRDVPVSWGHCVPRTSVGLGHPRCRAEPGKRGRVTGPCAEFGVCGRSFACVEGLSQLGKYVSPCPPSGPRHRSKQASMRPPLSLPTLCPALQAAEHSGEWPKRPLVPWYSVEEKGGFVWLFNGSKDLPEVLCRG